MLVLLAAMALVGLASLSRTGARMAELSAIGNHTLRLALAEGKLVEARRNVTLVADHGLAAAENKAKSLFAELQPEIAQLGQIDRDDQRRKNLEVIGETLKDHLVHFRDVVDERDLHDEMVTQQLNVLGEEAATGLEAVIHAEMADHDMETAAELGLAMEQLMRVRLYTNRFLANLNMKAVEDAREAGKVFFAVFKTAEGKIADPARRATLRQAYQQGDRYLRTVDTVVTATMDLDRLTNKIMATQAQEMADLVAETRSSQLAAYQSVQDQAFAGIRMAESLCIGLSLFALGLGLAGAVAIAASIVKPVGAMTTTMSRLASGDKNIDIPAKENEDEIGEMARAVAVFRDSMIESERLRNLARDNQAHELALAQKREMLTSDFDVMIRRVLAKLDGSVRDVHGTSGELHAAALRTRDQSSAVATAAEQAAENIQTVALAAEELGTSTGAISRQVHETTRIAQEAVSGAQSADATVDGLALAATRIGEIVNLINTIASQTNLLALNATIEAARAGEAGKGFAVVAGEVKSLAIQTARATGEIAEQIAGIQTSTSGAVEAIKTVQAAISHVNEVVASIAAQVEEQNASTHAIVRNVHEAAERNLQVSRNIAQVSEAASATGEMAEAMHEVAQRLEASGTSLGKHVEVFLSNVKAG